MRGARLFQEELGRRGLAAQLPPPAADGFFYRYGRPMLFPWYRVYWPATLGAPPWRPETWSEVGNGFARFFRPDQLVALEAEFAASEPDGVLAPEELGDLLRQRLVRSWLVPADESLQRLPSLADSLVETVRLGRTRGRLSWTAGSGAHHGAFPDDLRASCPEGLDPVHTPESERAGLRRFLRVGWSIDDDGKLVKGSPAEECGPITTEISHRRHDGARRLMLGCSLAASAVPLANGAAPGGSVPGVVLRAAAIAGGGFAGWLHEDAFVISESATRKLSVKRQAAVHALIPVAASNPFVRHAEVGATVARGQTVVSAAVDLFALGFSRPDVRDMGLDPDTGLQVLEWKSDLDGEVVQVRREPIGSSRWRESIAATVREPDDSPLRVGDKLGTGHGLKGVVSRIVPDDEMPEGAEILLPYFGVVRRGAFGQLREMGLASLPKADGAIAATGDVRVLRQPQDAGPRCRVRGAESGSRGQRYGEWELMALVAHGADSILAELLSRERAAVSWLEREARLWQRSTSGEPSAGQLFSRALNRWLAALGDVHLEPAPQPRLSRGQVVEDAFDLELYGRKKDGAETSGPTNALVQEALALLEDEDAWEKRGGTARLRLKTGGREIHVVLLPPWLRRGAAGRRHPLTLSYARLIQAGTWWKRVEPALREVRRCLQDEGAGLPGFVRNHLLGRRLTRSGRGVIVPRPDLRIDQIALPRAVAEALFSGLSEDAKQVVLVNRNPTLHRRGLLALRPVVDNAPDSSVFGLPLGVLSSLAADFDGDQASVVALETEAARREAIEKLLPGSQGLRKDSFRAAPAFPLLKELSAPERELALALDTALSQEEWAEAHLRLVNELLVAMPSDANREWIEREVRDIDPDSSLWNGLAPDKWLTRATEEVDELCKGQRRKAVYGGILRRELYRRDASDSERFRAPIEALQAITERLVQGALKVKAMKLVELPPVKEVDRALAAGFDDELLRRIDATLDGDALRRALGSAVRLDSGAVDPLRQWLSRRGKGPVPIPDARSAASVCEDVWLRLLFGS